jgi:DNA transformation protein
MARTDPTTTPDDPFVQHCLELLRTVGPVLARRMFGGWGLSVDGLNIAVVIADTLYLKTTRGAEADWTAEGGRPFEYDAKGGKRVTTSYYTAPDSAMESPELMAPWARRALASALSARKAGAPAGASARTTTGRARAGAAAPASTPTRPRTRRAAAPAAKPSARRKSSSG